MKSRCDGAFYLAFRAGEYVRDKTDPRHIGRVSAVFSGFTIRVRWLDSGWISDLPANKLERVSKEEIDA